MYTCVARTGLKSMFGLCQQLVLNCAKPHPHGFLHLYRIERLTCRAQIVVYCLLLAAIWHVFSVRAWRGQVSANPDHDMSTHSAFLKGVATSCIH